MDLEEQIVAKLKEKKLKLVTAESCTGGLLSSTIINVSGASEVFDEGFITYSNEAKQKYLSVKKETLDTFGAVSKQTAEEMAKGAAMETSSDVAVGITGIAGPEGGTKEKPVGLVYISCYFNKKVTVKECRFQGNRRQVREQSVDAALNLLNEIIK